MERLYRRAFIVAMIGLFLSPAWPVVADQLSSGGYGLVEGFTGVFTSDADLNTNSKQVILDAGTAGDPAAVFGDDDDGTGTGIFRSAADTLAVAVNGSAALTVNATGTTTTGTLDVQGGILKAGPVLQVPIVGGLSTEAFRTGYTGSSAYFWYINHGESRNRGNFVYGTFDNRNNSASFTAPTTATVRPRLWVTSETDWTSDPTEWVAMEHDTTGPRFTTGDGAYQFEDDGGKGVTSLIDTTTESVTFANDASKTTTGSILPDGAMVVGVSGRVTTLLAGCTSVDVGDGVDQDLFADDVALAAGTTFDSSDATAQYSTIANGNWPMTSAGEITVTANGGNCTAGVVALTVHFLNISAATSN